MKAQVKKSANRLKCLKKIVPILIECNKIIDRLKDPGNCKFETQSM